MQQEFSRENNCYRIFFEKIPATGIFSRKVLQEFSREKYCNMNFLEKIIAIGIFSKKEMPQEFSRENYSKCQNGEKWKYLLRDLK